MSPAPQPPSGSTGAITPEFIEDKLKKFIRAKGESYLRDPNITSIGIGYKQRNGKNTGEIAIQFTVDRKAAPEALAAMETELIPAVIMVEGVAVPTDVIQRRFGPDYRVLTESEPEANPRKVRHDPVKPGISLGHEKVSAGTLGCIVYDRVDGTPYALSNWHVLHGPLGAIGDTIVQPGRRDDNRLHLNRLGKLVRSYLGIAGDGALASLEDRGFDPVIMDLGVQVERLGEPELGDKVIKSGRSSGVTHGIVTRIDTLVKLDYRLPEGEVNVGGFEIGPDPDFPPVAGEVSMSGDSGSVWLFKDQQGQVTNIMAGLHFAGEAEQNPDEYAIAAYPASIFEKLAILPQPPAVIEAGKEAWGFDKNFLRHRVDLPSLSPAQLADVYQAEGEAVIHYTHFSLALSRRRRLAYWVAWNIDGSSLRKLSRKGLKFILDPRIPAQFQVGESVYAGNRLDRGHIARRADLLWGSEAAARQANKDSFFFTNITPQMDNFNQSGLGGIWGRLEDAVFAEVDVEDARVSVIGGPIFHDDDREFRGVKIPRQFYKILAFVEDGRLQVRAFLLTQSLDQLELLDLKEFKVYQVTLSELSERSGLIFADALQQADGYAAQLMVQPEAAAARVPLTSLDSIVW